METLVSVIIPVYNVAPYLREALNSVVKQTYSNLEIIIIDDESTDGSKQICEEYKSDPRIRIVRQKHAGVSKARNTALSLATGDYIAFLDSDDAYYPDCIQSLLEAAIQENVDIAVCKYVRVRSNTEMKPSEREVPIPTLKQGTYSRKDALRALVDGSLNTSLYNKLYRASLWEGIIFPEGHNYEDRDVAFRLLDRCRSICMIDKLLYLYRKRPGSITDTYSPENIMDRYMACSHMEGFVEAHTPDIFTERQLQKNREQRLTGMMIQYIRAREDIDSNSLDLLKKEIVETGKRINISNCRFSTKLSYWVTLYCPWLFRFAYSLLPVRLIMMKINEK